MSVLMLVFVGGTILSFGEFLKEMETEFCIGSCKKKLGWVESISVGKFFYVIVAKVLGGQWYPCPALLGHECS